jgi:YNFM family putative membrane transporter
VPRSTRGHGSALVSATAANFGQFGARVAISPFVLGIAATFGTSKSVIGLVLTGMWASYALLQFPSGVLADRYGERRVVLVALGAAATGSLLVSLSQSLLVFGAAALVLGSGAGLYFAAGTALLDRRFENTARAFSIHSAGGPLAGLAVPVVAAAVATRWDWRAGVLVGGVGALGALALAIVAIGDLPPASPDSNVRARLHPRTVVDLLSRPAVAFTTVVGVIGMYVFQAFVSFFPTFLQEHHHLTRGRAALLTGVAFVLIAVVMPFVGEVADRIDLDWALVVPLLVTATGFTLLVLVPDATGHRWAGVGLVGVGLTWGGAIQARFMRQFGPGEGGTGFGLVRTVFVLLGSVGNVATGVLADAVGWSAAYGVVAGLLVVAAVLVVGNRLLGLGL